ncbi:uncharacterized protein TNCV_2757141 [Trichonephila clavipes]|nr:uncharacterized protein TNCV_2757141 [Trichonephila clavipes]
MENAREVVLKKMFGMFQRLIEIYSLYLPLITEIQTVNLSTPTECWLKVNDDVVLYGSRNVNGSLFKANLKPILPKEMIEVHTVIADSSLLQLYHERWGHQDKRHIRNMLEKELGIPHQTR